MFRGRVQAVVRFTAIALIAMVACSLPSHKVGATAGINSELSFEGKIVSSTGTNITDGNYNAEFVIYTGCTNEPTSSTGCTAVWKEDYLTSNSTYATTTPVAFTSGTFQVNLGSICVFSGGSCEGNTNTAINWDSYPLYMSINVGTTAVCAAGFASCGGGTGAMNPYILLTASPYAMNAANADSLGGVAASSYAKLSSNNTWTGTNYIQTASTTALQVGSSSSATVLAVDTSGNQVIFGSNSNVNGKLVLDSSAASGSVGLTVATSSFTGYTLILPSAVGSANQCLQNSTTPGTLAWGSCMGNSATTMTLVPEYAGAVFSASGSNNQGYMQSDHTAVSSGYTDNYYDWTTDQTTAQTYDIVVESQVPSNFSSFVAASMKIWAQVDSTSNNALTVDVHDGATDCTSGFTAITPSGTTWSQQSMPSLSGCTIAANNILTFDFRLSATYASSTMYHVRLGELSFQYN
jgi:hypothetical protein